MTYEGSPAKVTEGPRLPNGTGAAGGDKPKQLMDAVSPDKMLLVDFKSIVAEVTSGTGVKPLIPGWMKGQRENPDKPSMKKARPSPPYANSTWCCTLPSLGRRRAAL